MTSVSAGHIILTPTQPVGSGRPQRESNPGPPHQESRALALYRLSYRAPNASRNANSNLHTSHLSIGRHSLSPLTWSRRGGMIDTSYDSERQAGLSSTNLVRVGLSSPVHSLRLSAQHLTCLPRSLPPSRAPCSTVLARLLWREMWPNYVSFLLFTIPNRFSCCPARAFILRLTTLP